MSFTVVEFIYQVAHSKYHTDHNADFLSHYEKGKGICFHQSCALLNNLFFCKEEELWMGNMQRLLHIKSNTLRIHANDCLCRKFQWVLYPTFKERNKFNKYIEKKSILFSYAKHE